MKKRRDLGIGSLAKVSIDVGLGRLKVIPYVAEKTARGREFQSLEVMGTNECVYAIFRLVSNLSAYIFKTLK